MKKIDLSHLADGAAVKFAAQLLLAVADGKVTPDECLALVAAGEKVVAGLRHAHTNTQAILDSVHIAGVE